MSTNHFYLKKNFKEMFKEIKLFYYIGYLGLFLHNRAELTVDSDGFPVLQDVVPSRHLYGDNIDSLAGECERHASLQRDHGLWTQHQRHSHESALSTWLAEEMSTLFTLPLCDGTHTHAHSESCLLLLFVVLCSPTKPLYVLLLTPNNSRFLLNKLIYADLEWHIADETSCLHISYFLP